MSFFKRIPVLGLFGVVATFGVYACSSDDTPATGTKTDGGAQDGSVPGNDGSAPDGAVGTDGGTTDAAPVSTRGGVVAIGQNKTVVGALTTYSTYASATFYEKAPVVAAPSNCTITKAGTCNVTECDLTADAGSPPTGDAGTPPPPPNAGDITFTGGLIASTGIVLKPGTDGRYPAQTGSTQIFSGGENLTVAFTGAKDSIPAFAGKALAAPSEVVVTPAISFLAPTTVSRTTDFKLTWTGGGQGNVTVNLGTVQNGLKSVGIQCEAAASAGTLTVPQAAVAKLQPTSTTQNGSISVLASNSTEFTAGDAKVTYVANGTLQAGAITTN